MGCAASMTPFTAVYVARLGRGLGSAAGPAAGSSLIGAVKGRATSARNRTIRHDAVSRQHRSASTVAFDLRAREVLASTPQFPSHGAPLCALVRHPSCVFTPWRFLGSLRHRAPVRYRQPPGLGRVRCRSPDCPTLTARTFKRVTLVDGRTADNHRSLTKM
jgi:hypothetical protein